MSDEHETGAAGLLASLPPEVDGLDPRIAAVDCAPLEAWSETDADGLRSFRCACRITVVWGPRDGLTLAQAEAAHRLCCAALRPEETP